MQVYPKGELIFKTFYSVFALDLLIQYREKIEPSHEELVYLNQ